MGNLKKLEIDKGQLTMMEKTRVKLRIKNYELRIDVETGLPVSF